MVAALTRVFVQRANEVAEHYADRVAAGNGERVMPDSQAVQDQQANSLKLHYHQPTPPGKNQGVIFKF